MTETTFKKANCIKGQIKDLEFARKQLVSSEYNNLEIRGVCSDGVTDHIDFTPDELKTVITNWYADKINSLKEEFEKL